MSTATLNKTIDKLTDEVFFPGTTKKASTVVKVICISTSKKSLKDSKKLVDFLENIIKNKLPDKHFNEDHVKNNYQNINANLQKIESFLEVINKIFQTEEEIEMDEKIMLDFLANMQKSQKYLSYISDYLDLVLQVQKEKKANKKESSFGELINLINAA